MRSEEWRAVDDSSKFVGNPLVAAQECGNRESTHAVAKQEERKIRPGLLNQCSDLVVELLNRKAVNTVSAGETETLIVHEMHTKAV